MWSTDSFRMSVELDKLAPDLVAFQQAVVDPRKDARNPHFKSKFVPLEGAIEALRPVANAHNFTITQWRSGSGLVTLFLHTSGQYIYGEAEMVLDKLTPQGMGSAITYERRYSLLAATGTSGDVDDDASAAEAEVVAPKPTPANAARAVSRLVDSIAGATTTGGLALVGKAIKESGLGDSDLKSLRALYSGKSHELEMGEIEQVLGDD